jgi:hypothetical protein
MTDTNAWSEQKDQSSTSTLDVINTPVSKNIVPCTRCVSLLPGFLIVGSNNILSNMVLFCFRLQNKLF